MYNFTITNNTKQQCTVKNKVNVASCNANFHPDGTQLIDNNGGSADFSVKDLAMYIATYHIAMLVLRVVIRRLAYLATCMHIAINS